MQNASLNGPQPWLGRFDKPWWPMALFSERIEIMLEDGNDRPAVQPTRIGEPIELLTRYLQPFGQISGGA
jgi:hypothetical protein